MYSATPLRYLVREGFTGIVRRRISGTVAVLIMGSSLLTLALFSLITINLDRILQSVRGDIDVVLYLADDIHPEDQALLEKDLLGTVGIANVRYVSRDDALARFQAELGDDADLLDALEANPLPASYELRLDPSFQDPERLDELTRLLSEYPGVEDVVAEIAWVSKLDHYTRIFMWVDLVVGILVLLSALFVISNTVRLTVEESADTVAIMKLVGATDWFIRMPYVLGGAVQGVMAGLLAMLVLGLAGHVVSQRVDGVFFFQRSQMLGFIFLSTALGAGGSLVALRRHLRL